MGSILRSLLFFAVLAPSLSFAERGPRDPKYKNLKHPVVDSRIFGQESTRPEAPARSEVLKMIRGQSPVKDQLYRGTCSIFSATSLYESMLIAKNAANSEIDLSEEWLQYLTTQATHIEGSTSPENFVLMRAWGQPSEKDLPYGGEAWNNKREGLALKRCGHLKRSPKLRACLVSHRDPDLLKLPDADLLNPNTVNYDPEFVVARRESLKNRDLYLARPQSKDGVVPTVSEIHALLAAGIPLALDLDFFYGAWNHPDGTAKGIEVSTELWQAGAITYPERGSIDRTKKDGGGHSVVVVGYDNDVELTYWMSMRDGKRKQFTRKGVYYIKNSWGTTDWGKNFEIEGVKFPGYGMISQDNAHEFGQFFHLDL